MQRFDNAAGAPAVSVLMTVYNEQPDRLSRAIDSILNQTQKDLEFIIVDDGSTRNETIDLLNQYSHMDSRIRMLHPGHGGVARALNAGLAQCRGQYICRQDSDDWSEPHRILTQVQYLGAHPDCALVGTNVMLHDEAGRSLWPTTLPVSCEAIRAALPSGNPFAHGSICVRKEAIVAVGGYRPQLNSAEDYDCFWRICREHSAANLPDALYHLRCTSGSVSLERAEEMMIAADAVRKLGGNRRACTPEDVESALDAARTLANSPRLRERVSLRQADRLLLSGHYSRAFLFILRVAASRPWRLIAWGKLIRIAFYVALPPLRVRMFHRLQ